MATEKMAAVGQWLAAVGVARDGGARWRWLTAVAGDGSGWRRGRLEAVVAAVVGGGGHDGDGGGGNGGCGGGE